MCVCVCVGVCVCFCKCMHASTWMRRTDEHLDVLRAFEQALVELPRALCLALGDLKVDVGLPEQLRHVQQCLPDPELKQGTRPLQLSCISIHPSIHPSVHPSIHMHVCVRVCMHACMYWMYVHTHARTHARTHASHRATAPARQRRSRLCNWRETSRAVSHRWCARGRCCQAAARARCSS